MARNLNKSNVIVCDKKTKVSLAQNVDWPGVTERPGKDRRILIYSHDTFGLGHLQRCLKISRSLVAKYPDISVLLVTGSPLVHRFDLPERVDYVKLPAVRKVGPEQYEARCLKTSYSRILDLRTSLILESVKRFAPHLLLVDHSPRGMKGEMIPALKWLSSNDSQCTTVLGLRDIVDDPETVIQMWERDGIYDDISTLYDHIVVYGSQDVFDLTAAYAFSSALIKKTTFCNYICEQTKLNNATGIESEFSDGRPLVTVTIGGGDGAGDIVIGTYLKMLREFGSKVDYHSVIVTGPFIDEDLFKSFKADCEGLDVTLKQFVPNMREYFARSDLVVATGGYNTVTELVSTARRALLIPRAMYRREQLMRSERFAELGLVNMIAPTAVSPRKMFEEIQMMLKNKSEPLTDARAMNRVRLDGTTKVTEFCGRLLRVESSAEVRQNG